MFGNTTTYSTLQKIHELTQVEWKAVGIFSDVEDESLKCFVSPTFTFIGATWRLLLAGKFLSNPESTSLTLMRNEHRNCSVEYTFGLKRLDGSVELLDRGILKNDQMQSERHFIKLSEVQQQQSQLAPSGIITVTCSLRLEGPNMKPQRKKLKRLDLLSRNFKDLFTTKVVWDIILRVKETDFQAHKAVLVARSNVFSAMFQHDTSEQQSGIITIPDCDLESFPLFLEYLYTGQLDELSFNIALNLFETSEKYGVLDLKNFCREHLMENLAVENWFEIISMADMYNDEKLFTAAQDYFIKNYRSIFHSPDWEQLMMNNTKLASKIVKELP